jgi:hypothetical protein
MKLVSLLLKQLFDTNTYVVLQPSICFSYQINSIVRFIKPFEAQREHKASLIVVMMKMSFARSDRPSKPGAQGNHGARIPPAAIEEPPTPKVETAQATADAICPIDGSLIGTTMKGKVTMVTQKHYTPVISKVIFLCDFPSASIMVCYIDKQGLKELEDVISFDVDEQKDFFTVCSDGFFEAKPMQIHLCMFKAFLLYLMRKGQELSTTLNKDDVLNMKKTEFKKYCCSANQCSDAAVSGSPELARTITTREAIAREVDTTMEWFTIQKF